MNQPGLSGFLTNKPTEISRLLLCLGQTYWSPTIALEIFLYLAFLDRLNTSLDNPGERDVAGGRQIVLSGKGASWEYKPV